MGLVKEMKATGFRPRELYALVRYKQKAKCVQATLEAEDNEDWRYCFSALCQVSRSFSFVIMELEPKLRYPVCIFYLVLRALDTIEDDTSQPADIRADLCTRFHTFLYTNNANTNADTDASADEWNSDQFGTKAERELCMKFPIVVRCFATLNIKYQEVIAEITRKMGFGMAKHIRDTSCDTLSDYDEYCHYVAGLVGYGLSDLFTASGDEAQVVSTRKELSNSMGLFLQKTNIIRDYLEDSHDGRTFWPRDIWCKYAKTLESFASCDSISTRKSAVHCLNHLVTDALRHAEDCISYMQQIRSHHVFNFVSIPQVMAIATLSTCYNNEKVFEGKVKIRRSQTAQLALYTKCMDDIYQVFFDFAAAMLVKVPNDDPNAKETKKLLNSIIDLCQPHVVAAPSNMVIPNVLSLFAFGALSSYVLKRRQDHFDGAVFTWRSAGGIMEPLDMLAIAALFIVCIYLFGFFLLPYMAMYQKAEMQQRLQLSQSQVVQKPDDLPQPGPGPNPVPVHHLDD